MAALLFGEMDQKMSKMNPGFMKALQKSFGPDKATKDKMKAVGGSKKKLFEKKK